MTKQKTSAQHKPAAVVSARKMAGGFFANEPTNREQRRDLARALKRSKK